MANVNCAKSIEEMHTFVFVEVPSTMSQDSQEDVLLDVEVEEVEVDHHDSQMVSQMSEDEVDESQNVVEGRSIVCSGTSSALRLMHTE